MTGDRLGSCSNNTCESVAQDTSNDEEYIEITLDNGFRRKVKVSTKKIIVSMHQAGATEKAIRARYPWFRRNYIQNFLAIDQDVEQGERSRIQQINEFVAEMADKTIRNRQPLHDYMLVRWAVQKAGELNARGFFTASHTWLLNLKKRADVVSRKITAYITKASLAQQVDRAASISAFRERYLEQAFRFPPRLIFNVDQTGFNYVNL